MPLVRWMFVIATMASACAASKTQVPPAKEPASSAMGAPFFRKTRCRVAVPEPRVGATANRQFNVVRVLDIDGCALHGVTVQLVLKRSLQASVDESFFGRYASKTKDYGVESLAPGRYLLRVHKTGYRPVQVFVAVKGRGFYQQVYLEKNDAKERPFVIVKNTKALLVEREYVLLRSAVPLDVGEVREVLVRMGRRSKSRGSEKQLGAISLVPDPPYGLWVGIQKFGSEQSRRIVMELKKLDQVTKVDRGLVDREGNRAIVFVTVYVKFFQETTSVERNRILERSDVRLITEHNYDVNAFTIEYTEANTKDIFEFALALLATGLVEVAEVTLDFRNERTAAST